MRPAWTLVALLTITGLTLIPHAAAEENGSNQTEATGTNTTDPFADDEPLFDKDADPFAAYERQAHVPDDAASALAGGDDGAQAGSQAAGADEASSPEGTRDAPGLGLAASLAALGAASSVALGRRRR